MKEITKKLIIVALLVAAFVNFGMMLYVGTNPSQKNGQGIIDITASMSEPDKTYAKRCINETSSKSRVVIVLDYELSSFELTAKYFENLQSMLQYSGKRPYIVATYFKDKEELIFNTNIKDKKNLVKSIEKFNVNGDEAIVKELQYYLQNVEKSMGAGYEFQADRLGGTWYAWIQAAWSIIAIYVASRLLKR